MVSKRHAVYANFVYDNPPYENPQTEPDYEFSLFQSRKSFTGAFIKEWCQYHMKTKSQGDRLHDEAALIYYNHWIAYPHPPNPVVYYRVASSLQYVFKLNRDMKMSPKGSRLHDNALT